MKKDLNVKLITNSSFDEYNLEGEYIDENQILSYYEKDELKTSMKIDLKNKKIVRENSEYLVEYDLSKNKGLLTLKDMNRSVDLSIKSKEFTYTKNKIKIEYELNYEEKVLLEIDY